MPPTHTQLAAGRWHSVSLLEQLANIGSEVARAGRWYESNRDRCEQTFVRALELLDLTITDLR